MMAAMKRKVLALGAIAALAACGGTSNEPGGGGIDTGHKPAAGPPANTVGSFFIQLPEETIGPGAEMFPCYIFPLQLMGPSHIVGGGKLTTVPGMHHGNVTTRPKTGDGFRACSKEDAQAFGAEGIDIAKGGAVLFASSTQITGVEWSTFPDGMGFPIADGYEIVARMHYLNTSTMPLKAAPKYEWFTIDEKKVTQKLGPFAWVLKNFKIPPMSDYTAASTCHLLDDMNVVTAMPHMHALGVGFFAEHVGGPHDGQRFLDSKGYDPDKGVITQYVPAAPLGKSEDVRWGCKWHNSYNDTIVEGVGKNEMCILFGYAYPYAHAYSALSSEVGCAMIAPPDPK